MGVPYWNTEKVAVPPAQGFGGSIRADPSHKNDGEQLAGPAVCEPPNGPALLKLSWKPSAKHLKFTTPPPQARGTMPSQLPVPVSQFNCTVPMAAAAPPKVAVSVVGI